MKSLKILTLLLLSSTLGFGQSVSSYKPFVGWGISKSDAKDFVVIRSFWRNSSTYYFVVSPQTLDTKILRSDSLIVNPSSWDRICTYYSNSPYIQALTQAKKYNDTIQDAGFKHFRSSQKGIDLTIDLCPSSRPLDRIVFNEIIEVMGQVEKPVPLAISITGRWIINHPSDLNWLDSLVRVGCLSIVWINHSFNHHTYKNVPIAKNFMLAQGTDINAEVLNTEIALLQKKILPSVFFRFPGLVSDPAIYDKIVELGLIPIGSDAWLAKGQHPENGSIVLIHANGNEPLGVRQFIQLLKSKQAEVLAKHWELYDLRESIVDDESK
jgi:hypothetical protein